MNRYDVWLSLRRSLGRNVQRFLLERFDDAKQIYDADEQTLRRLPLPGKAAESLTDKDLREAEKILDVCARKRIGILGIRDGDYPEVLREIDDPPVVLYFRGTLPVLSERPTIGVVGARRASFNAQKAASMLGYQIVRCGAAVVTGLARGVDSLAAEGALRADGCVIGVLGCGPDVVYPVENRDLYEAVMQKGCIVTEYPPGTRPLPENFPARNRIISGLSDGVVVVEAGERSGALITARHAVEQGRDVFAVPGGIFEECCVGSNQLLRSGAIPVTCGWDAVQEYAYRYPDAVTPYEGGEQPPQQAPQPKPVDVTPLLKGANEEEQKLIRALAAGERQLDELVEETELPPGGVMTALTLLQVRGVVVGLPGKRFRLNNQE